jgi:GxxExxY protein
MTTENEAAKIVIDRAVHIHQALGPGLLESVYETVRADELRRQGLHVERQKPIPIVFEGRQFDEGFRADLIVNSQVIIELKSIEQLARVHKKQVLTYLRLSGIKLGLLINFGGELMRGNMQRLVNGLPE